MKALVLACTLFLICLSSPSQADPKSDADYIVSQTVTHAMFEGALAVQRPLIVSAMQNDLRKKQITLKDPDKFFDLFMEEFLGEFIESMRQQSASIYLENFSEQQLEDIAEFMKTDSGQVFLSATPTLMSEGARMGQQAGLRAGKNAGKRLAKRIETEGLVVIDNPSLLSRLLDSLR